MKPKLAAALALMLALLGAAGAPALAQARGPAAARMIACTKSLAQPARFLVAEGAMRRLRRASRMQMRFELQSRDPGRPQWRKLAAPGFGVWKSADPSVRNYAYQKRVEALAAPADYRMVVDFRWVAGGHPVAQQRRVTRICRQPDVRPDLVPRALAVKGAKKGARRYVVKLANAGLSASGPFSVVVIVNGAPLPAAAVPDLQPGGRTRIELTGPSCAPGSNVIVRVDPDGRVDEHDEAGNELVRPCT